MTHSPSIDERIAQIRASIGSPGAAAELCRRTLDTWRHELSDRQFCDLQYLLGISSRLAGAQQEAESALVAGLSCAVESGERALAAKCQLELGQLAIERSECAVAIARITPALKFFIESHSRLDEAQALYALSNAYWGLRDDLHTQRYLRQALVTFNELHDAAGIAAVHCGLAYVAIEKGDFSQGIERLELCLRILPSGSLERNRIHLQYQLARCYFETGQRVLGERIIKPAIERAGVLGYHFLEAQGLMLWHCALKDAGELDSAAPLLERATALATEHGFIETLDRKLDRR